MSAPQQFFMMAMPLLVNDDGDKSVGGALAESVLRQLVPATSAIATASLRHEKKARTVQQ